ncbi:hypothetical protein EDB81DRAFT_833862 [Dactylonectria macrodidyma]|uniref:Uncharacterized protein n=1 Tax=Dactylonectria macrodidyma TaxID=307937 RepID=A0A9P9CYT2_9HYPO|nr:hypothetical protein EDB81DRAFT_833862 [Dactylonectria macrodidyma]
MGLRPAKAGGNRSTRSAFETSDVCHEPDFISIKTLCHGQKVFYRMLAIESHESLAIPISSPKTTTWPPLHTPPILLRTPPSPWLPSAMPSRPISSSSNQSVTCSIQNNSDDISALLVTRRNTPTLPNGPRPDQGVSYNGANIAFNTSKSKVSTLVHCIFSHERLHAFPSQMSRLSLSQWLVSMSTATNCCVGQTTGFLSGTPLS